MGSILMKMDSGDIMTIETRGKRSAEVEISRWLAIGAIAGPVIFIFAMFVLGSLRPGYSFVSQSVSALGVGPNSVFMNAGFVLNGLLLIVGVIAVFRTATPDLGAVARLICAGLLLLSLTGVLRAASLR